MDEIKLGFKRYSIVETITENGDLLMLLIRDKKKSYIYKKYRTSEPYLDELERYTNLYKAGIYIPKITYKNRKNHILIYNHLEGDHVDKVLMDNELKLDDYYYEQLFLTYRFARFSKIELNYLPENFILIGKTLYYDCLEIYNTNAKINLENYGIYFWVKSKEAIKHLSALGYDTGELSPLPSASLKKEIVLLSIKYW